MTVLMPVLDLVAVYLDEPPADPLIDIDVPIDPVDLLLLPPLDIDDCGPCRGTGEVYAGYDEHDTGAPVTVACGDCRGSGRGR